MELYSSSDNYQLYQGNMLDMLQVIKPNSIDSIVTDPPYGLTSITKRFGKEGSAQCQYGTDGRFQRLSRGFMDQQWDGSGIEYNVDTWRNCYEVLKPGGYLLAFGGTRTFHRIACAIEDAGFEIRDTIMWLYGSGFPKSLNIGAAIDKKGNNENVQNEWDGWGTALKPAYEPIIVARKPCESSTTDNVLKYGVGAINIDECRIPFNGDKWETQKSGSTAKAFNLNEQQRQAGTGVLAGFECQANDNGRFPSNIILTYDETDEQEVCGGMPNSKGASSQNNYSNGHIYRGQSLQESNTTLSGYREWYNDDGSAARYFYCAKASILDRDEGLEDFEEQIGGGMSGTADQSLLTGSGNIRNNLRKNIHPTVKPTDLMQYLIRLVTPQGGTILDPFNGSGSTGKACMLENVYKDKHYKYIGIEITEKYLPIAKERIERAENAKKITISLPTEGDSNKTEKVTLNFSLF